jgi:hypothetical protein
MVDTACQFSRLRSKQLAHATTASFPQPALEEWLVGTTPRAFAVSLAFVHGYLAAIRED